MRRGSDADDPKPGGPAERRASATGRYSPPAGRDNPARSSRSGRGPTGDKKDDDKGRLGFLRRSKSKDDQDAQKRGGPDRSSARRGPFLGGSATDDATSRGGPLRSSRPGSFSARDRTGNRPPPGDPVRPGAPPDRSRSPLGGDRPASPYGDRTSPGAADANRPGGLRSSGSFRDRTSPGAGDPARPGGLRDRPGPLGGDRPASPYGDRTSPGARDAVQPGGLRDRSGSVSGDRPGSPFRSRGVDDTARDRPFSGAARPDSPRSASQSRALADRSRAPGAFGRPGDEKRDDKKKSSKSRFGLGRGGGKDKDRAKTDDKSRGPLGSSPSQQSRSASSRAGTGTLDRGTFGGGAVGGRTAPGTPARRSQPADRSGRVPGKSSGRSARPADTRSTRRSRGATAARPLPRGKERGALTVHQGLDFERKIDLIGIVLVAFGLVAFFSVIPSMSFNLLPEPQGGLTGSLNHLLSQVFGWGKIVWPLVSFVVGVWLMKERFGDREVELDYFRIVGMISLYACALVWIQMLQLVRDTAPSVEAFRPISYHLAVTEGQGGGWVGHEIYVFLLSQLLDFGTVSVMIAWLVMSLMLTFDLSVVELWGYVARVLSVFSISSPEDRARKRAAREAMTAEIVAAMRPGDGPRQLPLDKASAARETVTATAVAAGVGAAVGMARGAADTPAAPGEAPAGDAPVRSAPVINRRGGGTNGEPAGIDPDPAERDAAPDGLRGRPRPLAAGVGAGDGDQAGDDQVGVPRTPSRRRMPHFKRPLDEDADEAAPGGAAGGASGGTAAETPALVAASAAARRTGDQQPEEIASTDSDSDENTGRRGLMRFRRGKAGDESAEPESSETAGEKATPDSALSPDAGRPRFARPLRDEARPLRDGAGTSRADQPTTGESGADSGAGRMPGIPVPPGRRLGTRPGETESGVSQPDAAQARIAAPGRGTSSDGSRDAAPESEPSEPRGRLGRFLPGLRRASKSKGPDESGDSAGAAPDAKTADAGESPDAALPGRRPRRFAAGDDTGPDQPEAAQNAAQDAAQDAEPGSPRRRELAGREFVRRPDQAQETGPRATQEVDQPPGPFSRSPDAARRPVFTGPDESIAPPAGRPPQPETPDRGERRSPRSEPDKPDAPSSGRPDRSEAPDRDERRLPGVVRAAGAAALLGGLDRTREDRPAREPDQGPPQAGRPSQEADPRKDSGPPGNVSLRQNPVPQPAAGSQSPRLPGAGEQTPDTPASGPPNPAERRTPFGADRKPGEAADVSGETRARLVPFGAAPPGLRPSPAADADRPDDAGADDPLDEPPARPAHPDPLRRRFLPGAAPDAGSQAGAAGPDAPSRLATGRPVSPPSRQAEARGATGEQATVKTEQPTVRAEQPTVKAESQVTPSETPVKPAGAIKADTPAPAEFAKPSPPQRAPDAPVSRVSPDVVRRRAHEPAAAVGRGDNAPQGNAPNVPRTTTTVHAPGKVAYELPDFRRLLRQGDEQRINDEILLDKARVIEDTLASFGAPGKVVEVNPGPVITQFGIEPDYVIQRGGKKQRVKVGQIARLDADLALALAAKSIRIEAPVPGRGFVGIEVPNDEVALVGLYDIMDSPEFRRIDSKLRIALGLGIDGTPMVADLTAMPHLLIAGTTGSGKSVCVNAIIACLLLSNTPDDVQFIMVDPKRVELTGYNGIPHLVAPVVVDLERIVGVLQWVQREMEERYRKFAAIAARNIIDYNNKIGPGERRMPYYIVVVDELADLMMLAPDETERLLARLAQMSRATGIHLIISTQRPSVDIITGLIKANFPARIAFAVASSVDSRVILDQPGAEKLLGRGDMLYQSPDAAAPLRMQGAFVSDEEIMRIARYWKGLMLDQADAAGERDTLTSPSRDALATPLNTDDPRRKSSPAQHTLWTEDSMVDEDGDGQDDMYGEAVELVQRLNKASISLLQRRLRIGYTRAARLIDLMEAEGIVGPPQDGSKPREVLKHKARRDGDD